MLPIVLYNGEANWSAATNLADLSESHLPAQLLRYQPQIRYLLLQEHRYDDADLAGLHSSKSFSLFGMFIDWPLS